MRARASYPRGYREGQALIIADRRDDDCTLRSACSTAAVKRDTKSLNEGDERGTERDGKTGETRNKRTSNSRRGEATAGTRGVKKETKRRKEGASVYTRVRGEEGRRRCVCGTRSQSVEYGPRLGHDRQGQPLPASYICSATGARCVLPFTFIYLFINIARGACA